MPTNNDRNGLRCVGLTYAVGQGSRAGVDLEVRPGEALQVSGPSGSGKTTLLRVLARLHGRLGGEMLLDGEPAEAVEPRRWRRRVAYLHQRPTAFEGSVEANLRRPFELGVAERDYDVAEVGELLRRVGLAPERYLGQDARTLSGGELQRLALVRCWLTHPRVLLADEPTASVDAVTAATLAGALADWVAGGGSLILVVHDEGPWSGLPRRRLDLTVADHTREKSP